MPHVVLVNVDDVANVTIAGRSLRDHWSALVAEAGLRSPALQSPVQGSIVVVDARYPAIRAQRLRDLAQALAAEPPAGSALQSADGQVLAVALPDADPARGAELLVHPGGPTHVATRRESYGVADPFEHAKAERAVVDGLLQRLAAVGVRLHDPDRIWVDRGVRVAPGATVWGGAVLLGETRIGMGATVHAGAWLRDTVVGERAVIKPHSVCDGARIGAECAVGPSAHLRPGAVLERDVRVGNFVEVKKAHLHSGVRAGHLSYLGDAEIGAGSNIGAGTITCNYDGFGKHRTEIGPGAFIGSNTALVAPITIGEGVIVGAGSTLSRDVPAQCLAVERAEARVLEGKAPRLRESNRRRAEPEPSDG